MAAVAGRAWRRLAGAAMLLALAACGTLPQPTGQPAADAFSRAGRFAITATETSDGTQQAVQGGFVWRDDGNRYQLDLTTPLGSTEARVEGQPGAAMLTRSNGTRMQAPDPDSLAEDALGSPVPVSGLRDWLRGKPGEPAPQALQSDAQGHPASFTQRGWQARLSRYDAQGPQLLVLERLEGTRRIVVRLVVDSP
ncbi:outer membrane lipoprotein LolB [Bordetella ansorpii]|uniref:Outer-membrane lipoprotein LolB n=1 Tax=Bordetella ansorpii TaxID=288768 RepID=A0A157P1Z3_9BORD|nr:lipoprotein insertase outer membrane protein LolB [Bordetella ansorpii]SAI27380.1 outer membrane lipoprotein LolB [Bordetella ansorpii]